MSPIRENLHVILTTMETLGVPDAVPCASTTPHVCMYAYACAKIAGASLDVSTRSIVGMLQGTARHLKGIGASLHM
jgi:hypothetical protein